MTAFRLLFATVLTIISAVFVAAADDSAKQQRRVALVLGNAAYLNVPQLANPVRDATAISATLEKLGFEVVSGYDLGKLETQDTIARFAKTVRGDIALFFYAGHGMQVAGNNYLLPVDAALEDETSLDFETVPMNFIIKQMSRETGIRLVFLDACRDNPLVKAFGQASGMNDVSSGLAEIQIENAGKGTLIAFATSPNQVAYDGAGDHSPFSTALLAHIGEPNLPISSAMTRITADVVKATAEQQRPWVNVSLTDDVILNPAAESPPAAETPVAEGSATSPGRTADVGANSPEDDEAQIALNMLRQRIPEIETKGPIAFDTPIMFGDPAIDGKSIRQLIDGKPLYAPIEGLDKSIWDNQCTSCHQWTKEQLCEQARNYDKIDISIMRLEHPLGTKFKVALASWARDGCR